MPGPSSLHSSAAATAPAGRRHWPVARWLPRHRAGLLTTLLGLALLPFVGLAFYNQPFSNDFGTALLVRDAGSAWGAQCVLFATWSGRYTANLLQTLANPLVHNWPGGFRLAPLLLLGGTVLALRAMLGERALAGDSPAPAAHSGLDSGYLSYLLLVHGRGGLPTGADSAAFGTNGWSAGYS